MGSSWRNKYDELKEYMVTHPTIEIKPSVTVIPDEVRPDFYRLFNMVRTEYIRETHPALLAEANVLSNKYAEVRKTAISCLSLEAIEVNPDLGWFLKDPVDGLMRKLFDPLFELLQGKIDAVSFERLASKTIENLTRTLLYRGYLHWVTLSLISLMAPDEVYLVPVPDETIESTLVNADGRPGWFWEEIPDLVELKKLSLDVSEHTPLLVPQVIIHSDRLKVCVSMRTDFHDVYFKAYKLFDNITSMEWYRIEDIRARYGIAHLWPDIGIYLNDAGKELRVVADYLYMARPDAVIDVMENSDWYESGGMEIVKRHNEVLKPRLGNFVICREPLSQAAIKELKPGQQLAQSTTPTEEGMGRPTEQLEETPAVALINETPLDIKLLRVGYDACKLEPIINAIAESRVNA